MKADEAFKRAYKIFLENKIPSASLDAEVLLLEAINKKVTTKRDKAWLYTNYKTYELTQEDEKVFTDFIKQRKKHKPIAYITGKKEFYGLDFFVNQNVLIPRDETELIIELVIMTINKCPGSFTLLDVGTGSGCIPISVLKQKEVKYKIERVFANDISLEALKIARINARNNGVFEEMKFIGSDLEKAIKKISKEKNIIITANLPYISEDAYRKLDVNVKNFEPKIALVAPENGLFQIKRMIETFSCIERSFSNYFVFIEADPMQMRPLERFAKEKLYNCQVEVLKDLRGKKRIIEISRKQ
jgi:release factor glutamine methyltransferase